MMDTTDNTSPELNAARYLDFRVGDSTIGENIEHAIAAGELIRHEDGRLELPSQTGPVGSWIYGPNPTPYPCQRLFHFLFRIAYARQYVPNGCQSCYKLAIKPTTLKQLHAVTELAATTNWPYKCGTTLGMKHVSGVYAALFYADSLQQARVIYRELRSALDQDEQLGPDISLQIRRGCTEYELHCGPSDQFRFDPQLAEVEQKLLQRFMPSPFRKGDKRWIFTRWLHVAHQVGDNSYRSFNGDQPLYPAPIVYTPDE